MSNFNDANDLASQLVEGRYYQSGEPCPKPARIDFTHRQKEPIISMVDDGTREWADVASEIHGLLNAGYEYTLET